MALFIVLPRLFGRQALSRLKKYGGGKLWVRHNPGDRHSPNHRRKRDKRLFLRGSGWQIVELRRHGFHQLRKAFRRRFAHVRRAACQFTPQGYEGAAASRVISVLRRKIAGNYCGRPTATRRGSFNTINERLDSLTHGFLDNLILRFEVLVKAPVSQPRRRHDVRQCRAANSFSPELHRRGIYDALPCLRRFLPRFSHRSLPMPHGGNHPHHPEDTQHLNKVPQACQDERHQPHGANDHKVVICEDSPNVTFCLE